MQKARSEHNPFLGFSFTRPPEREKGRVGENTRNEVSFGSEIFPLMYRPPYCCSKTVNETTAILAIHTYPVGIETFPYVKTFFCSNELV